MLVGIMLRVLLLLLAVLQLQAQLVKYEGRYTAIRIDDFVTPKMKPFLAMDDYQSVMISKDSINALPEDDKLLFRIGSQLAIEGEWKDDLFHVQYVQEKSGHRARQYAGRVIPRVNLIRRVLVIPTAIRYPNGDVGDVVSPDDVRRDLNESQWCYRKLIEQESWGKYSFKYTIAPKVVVNATSWGCEEYKWRDAAYEILKTVHNFEVLWWEYDSISLIIPDVGACHYGGMAFDTNCGHDITSYWCWTTVKNGRYVPTFAHEMGHNIAFAHANTASETQTWEYGDNSDPMGTPWPLTYHNAVHKIQVGWIPDDRIAKPIANASDTIVVTPTGTLIEPIGTIQAVRIPVRWNEYDTNIFISYRLPYGDWTAEGSLYNRVHVQIWPNPIRNGGGGWVDGPGRLAMLTEGQTYIFAGINITARDFTDKNATVLLNGGRASTPPPTVKPTPLPTVKPTPLPTVKPTPLPTVKPTIPTTGNSTVSPNVNTTTGNSTVKPTPSPVDLQSSPAAFLSSSLSILVVVVVMFLSFI